MKKLILERIKALEKQEIDSMEKLAGRLNQGEFAAIADEPLELVRKFQSFNYDGSNKLFDDNVDGRWANASDDVPILRQLLLDPKLIVDLRPVQTEEECLNVYGVDSSQLYKLATRGFLAFNLYAYESTKGINFEPYSTSQCKAMADLLLFSESKCRINSIRKQYFFERILKSSDSTYIALTSQYREIITWLFGQISDQKRLSLINKNLIRPGTSQGNIETLAQQMAYNDSAMVAIKLQGDDERYQIVKHLDDTIKENLKNPLLIEDTIMKIRGLKNCISTPYTASMGGVYNMSSGAVLSLYNVIRGTPKFREDDPLYKYRENHKEVKSLMDFIEGTSKRFNEQEQPLSDDTFRRKLSHAEFESYVDFLDVMREQTNKLNHLIRRLSSANNTYNNFIRAGSSYFQIEKEIEAELNKSKFFKGALKYSISGILGATTGVPAISESVVGFGLAGMLTGMSQDMVKSMNTARIIQNDNRRILGDLRKLRAMTD